jgi:hypothetical protein
MQASALYVYLFTGGKVVQPALPSAQTTSALILKHLSPPRFGVPPGLRGTGSPVPKCLQPLSHPPGTDNHRIRAGILEFSPCCGRVGIISQMGPLSSPFRPRDQRRGNPDGKCRRRNLDFHPGVGWGRWLKASLAPVAPPAPQAPELPQRELSPRPCQGASSPGWGIILTEHVIMWSMSRCFQELSYRRRFSGSPCSRPSSGEREYDG